MDHAERKYMMIEINSMSVLLDSLTIFYTTCVTIQIGRQHDFAAYKINVLCTKISLIHMIKLSICYL